MTLSLWGHRNWNVGEIVEVIFGVASAYWGGGLRSGHSPVVKSAFVAIYRTFVMVFGSSSFGHNALILAFELGARDLRGGIGLESRASL